MNETLGFDKGRQMIVDQRRKMTIAYCNHFVVANDKDYNEVHGKYSCIQIKAEDFKMGKGDKAIWAYHNVNPYEIRIIYRLAETVYPLNPKLKFKKEFYHPFKGSYSALVIEHNPELNNPFVVTITKGKCDKNLKRVGEPEIKVVVMYSNELFFSIWDTLYCRLRDWERYHYSLLLRNGEPKTAAEIAKFRNKEQDNSSYQTQQNIKQSNQQQKEQKMPQAVSQIRNTPLSPLIEEENIPFNQMPAYGSGYKR